MRAASSNPEEFDLALFQTTQFYTPPSEMSEDDMWVIFDQTIGLYVALPPRESVVVDLITCQGRYFGFRRRTLEKMGETLTRCIIQRWNYTS